MNKYRVEELIDLQQVRNLLEAQVHITGVPCGLMDNAGNILVGAGVNDVCTRFHWDNPYTFTRCWRNAPDIEKQLRTFSGEQLECRCGNGMVHMAIPVVIEGSCLAVFFSGSFFYDDSPPDMDWFRRQAEEAGFETEAYLAAVSRVPLFSRTYADKTFHFLHQMVQVLADAGYTNLMRLSELEDHKWTRRELLLLNRAIDASTESVFMMDRQGHFVYVNEEACRSLGYNREKLLTMTPLDIDPDLTPEIFGEMLEGLFTAGPTRGYIETRHRARDGDLFPVELSAKIIEFDDERFGLVVARDISERKQLDRELFMLSKAVNCSYDALFLIDPQFRFRYVNEAACRSLGYSRKELLTMGPLDIDTDVNLDMLSEIDPMASEAGFHKPFETSLRAKDGRIFPVEVGATQFEYEGIVYALSTVRDISERREAEQEINILNYALDHVNEGAFLLDLEGRFLYVNRQACHSLGYSKESLQAMSVFDVDPDYSAELLAEQIAELNRKGALTFETRHCSRSGHIFPVEITASLFEYGNTRYVLSLVRDITERKQAERQIKLLNFAIDHVGEAAFLIELNEGKFSYVNKEACRSLEYEPEELVGLSALDIDPDVTPDMVQKHIETLLRQGSVIFETRHRSRSGRVFPVEISSTIFEYDGVPYALSLVRDISERKLLEAELAEREVQFRTLAENTPNLIVRYDTQLRRTYVNPAWEETSGLAADEVVNVPIHAVLRVPHPGHAAYQESLRRVLATGGPERVEFEWINAYGETLFLDYSIVPEHDRQGEIAGLLAVGHDVTERRQEEQEAGARLRMLEAVYDPNVTLEKAMRGVLDEIEALTGSTIGFYHFFDEEQQMLSLQSWSTNTRRILCATEGEKRHYPVAMAGVWADAVRQRRPVIHNDYASLSHRRGLPKGHAGVVRELVVPVFRDGKIVAVIGVGNKPTDYLESDVRHVSLLGNFSWEIVNRKQAEEALRKSEREFRTLAENLPDNIVRYDRQGLTKYVNPVLEKTLGAAAADMIGFKIRELHFDEDYEPIAQAVDDTLATGRHHEIEFVQVKSGETPMVHQIRTIAEHDEYGEVAGVMAIGRDITERKRIEEERLAHLHFLENLDRVNLAIQETDELEQMMKVMLDAVLSIFDCDRAYLFYPCDPDAKSWKIPMERTTVDYPGANDLKVSISEDAWIKEKLRLLLASDGPVSMGAGSPYPLSGTTAERFNIRSLLAMAVYPKVNCPWEFGIHQCSHARTWTTEEERIFQEIGRRLADAITSLLIQRNLRQNEDLLRTLINSTPDIICFKDGQGRWLEANESTLELFHLKNIDYHGKTDSELAQFTESFYRSAFFTCESTDEKAWQSGEISRGDEMISRPDGTYKLFDFVKVPTFEPDGSRKGLVVLGRDITERKQAEQELREKQQHLNDMVLELALSEQRERRRIANDLHDRVGQDLTLAKIRIGSLDKTGLAEGQKELLGEVRRLTESSINRVRSLTRQLSPPVLESAGLEAALKWLARQLEADYGLQITFDDDQQNKPVLKEFQIELYNSVRELLINVAKHACTVTACLSLYREGDRLVIQVEDDGKGFDAESLVDNPAGEGFGLFTIKHRITHMGGAFIINSRLGSGTEITIKVPLDRYI